MKIIIDKAQSGGTFIIIEKNSVIIRRVRIEDLPNRDDNLIYTDDKN